VEDCDARVLEDVGVYENGKCTSAKG